MTFGTAIHAGIPEAWFNGPAAGFAAFDRVWDESGLESVGDEKRNRGNARLIISDFVSKRTGPRRMYDLVKPPHNYTTREELSPYEFPFALAVEGLSVPIIGRADGILRMTTTGQLWVMEYKTTSELAMRFCSSFEMNAQAVGYCIAAREMLGPILGEFQGTLVEGIRVNKSSWDVQGIPVVVRPHMVEMWQDWARFWGGAVLRAEAEAREQGDPDTLWPGWLDACNQIGMFGLPGYNCEYLPLCQAGGNWKGMTSLYKVDRHVPFTVKGKEVIL